jgi:hypothetical protein
LPGGRSAVVPPDPMPNSEVKRRSADGSVGSPHARVGNCQASNKTKNLSLTAGVFCLSGIRKLSARAWACDKRVGNTFERRVRRPQRGEYQDDTSTVGTARHQIKRKAQSKDWAFLLCALYRDRQANPGRIG